MNEGTFVAIAAATIVCLFGVWIGILMGEGHIKESCDKTGNVVLEDVGYRCERIGSESRGPS